MADIELLIKIPKEYYNYIKNISDYHCTADMLIIKNGIPIPRGHGRLGDLDKIQSMARKKAEDCFPEGRYDYGYRKALFDFVKDIDEAPTIIEADKE